MNSLSVNFQWVNALLVDPDSHSAELLSRILTGFGVKNNFEAETVESALEMLVSESPDLVFCESRIGEATCADLVRRIRQMNDKMLRVVPVIVFSGYTERGMVEVARDSGVNLVLKKPIEPSALYDRLAWIAKGSRAFVEAATYIGPDRRFKNVGFPNGAGRRVTDLAGEAGQQADTNMSQDEIDSMIKPMKIDS